MGVHQRSVRGQGSVPACGAGLAAREDLGQEFLGLVLRAKLLLLELGAGGGEVAATVVGALEHLPSARAAVRRARLRCTDERQLALIFAGWGGRVPVADGGASASVHHVVMGGGGRSECAPAGLPSDGDLATPMVAGTRDGIRYGEDISKPLRVAVALVTLMERPGRCGRDA